MGHNIEQGGLSFVEIQRFCGICPKTFETDQSLSEVVGTHVVLLVSGSLQFFTHNTAPLPLTPPQSVLFKPKHIKPDEKWDTTLNRGDCRLLKFKGFVASVPRLLKLIV